MFNFIIQLGCLQQSGRHRNLSGLGHIYYFIRHLNTSNKFDINSTFNNLKPKEDYLKEINQIITALEIFSYSFDECVNGLKPFVLNTNKEKEFEEILSHIRLYKIEKPFVALASNYGVPQNRERVLFIGCRKDQKIITDIPATVTVMMKSNLIIKK